MKRVTLNEAWTGLADCRNCNVRQSVLFAQLSEADFDAIHRPIDQLAYPPGSDIYTEGDPAGSILTIRAGLVKLTQCRAVGTQRIVRLLHRTDVIGLEALLTDSYQHTATVLHATEVCRIAKETVRDLALRQPALYNELMARWHRALSDADRWITEFNTGSARGRVARLLLWLVERNDGERCDLFSREDLGAVLGLTPETASRVMAERKRQGYISEPRPNHFLCDVPNLRRLAE